MSTGIDSRFAYSAQLGVAATVFALQLASFAPAKAQEGKSGSSTQNPRWAPISAVFGQGEQEEDGYFRVNLPRTDLQLSIATVEGAPRAVASSFRAVFAKTATPLAPSEEEKSTADWSAVDAVLGTHAESHGTIAEYVFPRREHLTMHGMPIKSSGTLETASEVVFQQLGDGRVANTGELFIPPGDAATLAKGVAAALSHMNSVQKSKSEGSD
jgi:hypothetical protein